ncbi:MAG: S-methyl-5'-thioadenosine phosphorylase [Patescibacteria group bacterium]|nr:S-methyl-5'-thioadenosine phosphorylase [Patescibacteria group bacterium]MDD5535009.1 S-methyl-5'-thioadenosine phosphorylase [Patescibacteria group bacterium]
MKNEQKIGIIGGSGFYSFLKGKEISVNTPYGKPSDKILLAEYAGKKIAFLPRHGKHHQFPPHKVPYQANLFALKKLGCEIILTSTAVGSLKEKIKPGDLVICDQFVDKTNNRKSTYFNGPKIVHISAAEPYCPNLRKIAADTCRKLKIPCHKNGTVVVIEGPRFSTKAESNFYSKMNWDVINMTQYPEVILARELEMCYLNISLVTDYDAGLQGRPDIKPVNAQEVMEVFRVNNEKVKKIFLEIIKGLPDKQNCSCGQALKNAIL